MERKEYDEINLPLYLQHDLDAMKEGKYPYDFRLYRRDVPGNTARTSK